MKTLKELLSETTTISKEGEIECLEKVKEWLTQKRQDENDYSMIPTRFWQGTIDELLEELNQN